MSPDRVRQGSAVMHFHEQMLHLSRRQFRMNPRDRALRRANDLRRKLDSQRRRARPISSPKQLRKLSLLHVELKCRREWSSSGRRRQRGRNVCGLKIRVVGKDLFRRRAAGDQANDRPDRDPHTADARLAPHHIGIEVIRSSCGIGSPHCFASMQIILSRLSLGLQAPRQGLEPWTRGLTVRCSTN